MKTIIAGRFELERFAGEGGMGAVYKATDRETGNPVAVKLVSMELPRFEREATLLATLQDDAIVGYVAHGRLEDGRMYLAMEWLEGESLEDRLMKGPLTIEESLGLARRVAKALASGHALGIVHRDVKPSNILLRHGRAEEAVLVDFGIARAELADTKALTRTGVAIGTPAFMAPEQVRGDKDIDGRADVFSLGAVLYECLTCRGAFTGEHVVAVLAKVLLEPAPRVRAVRRDVPIALDELIAAMLEKAPGARPRDIVRALDELDVEALQSTPRLSLGVSEQRYATVLLARPVAERTAQDVDATQGAEIVRAASMHGVVMFGLANGSFVAMMPAESAASYAHRMLEGAPQTVIAIATGRAIVAGQVPVGEAIDRAARLLSAHEHDAGVWLDDATSSIADAREQSVLGRVSPFVGRDREMALLDATIAECSADSVLAVTLFLAPPGIGKSRLRRELVERLHRRDVPPPVWLVLAHPLMAGSPFGFLTDLLSRSARSRITSPFLADLVDMPLDDPNAPAVRAARSNPKLFAEQVSEAFIALVLGVLVRGPLVLALEDLQWADAASLRVLEVLFERARDLPLFVLALARPSLDETHPRLWAGHRVQRVSLEPLHRKSAERLARALVGEGRDVGAIVQRAEGNALFLEELARVSAAGGDVDELPPTLAAVAEARLLALEPTTRQVLRAGAIFGHHFWRGAVAELVAFPVDHELAALEQQEIVATAPTSRFASDRELVFRHGIVRDAAYAMLTDDDRRLGHALAAKWLADRVDDPPLLAHHYERGGMLPEAAEAHALASENAAHAVDHDAMHMHIAHSRLCGATGHLEGRLRLALLDAAVWSGKNDEAALLGPAALALLEPGSAGWFVAAGGTIAALGKCERVTEMLEIVSQIEATPSDSPKRALACARAAIQVLYAGDPERALRLLDAASRAKHDPMVDGMLADAAFDFKFLGGRVLAPEVSLRARRRYLEHGDRRGAFTQASNAAMSFALIGAPDEGLRVCNEHGASDYVRDLNLAVRAAQQGDLGPMLKMPEALRVKRAHNGQRLWSAALLFPTDREAARKEILLAYEGTANEPGIHPIALALLSRLSEGNEAMRLTTEAKELSAHGLAAIGHCVLPLAHAEALAKVGRDAEVPDVLRTALDELDRAAAELGEWGPIYLERALCAAELRAMARARGVAH